MRSLKNHANIERRRNRKIRGIREPQSAFGGMVWIFRVFGVFRGLKNSLGEDLGQFCWIFFRIGASLSHEVHSLDAQCHSHQSD